MDKSVCRISITDVFGTDKNVANSTGAVMNIVVSAITPATRDENDRRATLIWCNELWEAIYKRALGHDNNEAIHLNVG